MLSHPGEPGEDGSKPAPKCGEATGKPTDLPTATKPMGGPDPTTVATMTTKKAAPGTGTTMAPGSTTEMGEKPGAAPTTAAPSETGPSKCEYAPAEDYLTTSEVPVFLAVKAKVEYDPVDGVPVVDGDYICPDDYDDGFSLACEVPYPTGWVKFDVDGKHVRTEKMAPYVISSDTTPAYGSIVRPWHVKEGPVNVTCVTDKESVYVMVTIGCDGTNMTSPTEVTEAPTDSTTTYVATKRYTATETMDKVVPTSTYAATTKVAEPEAPGYVTFGHSGK
jgi:hypothetical protein